MPGHGQHTGEGGFASTKCLWESGFQRFYDSRTYETQHVMAPFFYKEDFFGEGGLELGNTVDRWEEVEVGEGVSGLRADVPTGIWQLSLGGTDAAADAVLYWGDQLSLSCLADLNFEARIAFSEEPGNGIACVWGLGSNHNLDKDTMAINCWFRIDGAFDLLVETDDAVTNDDDNDTGTDLTATAWHIYRIDMSNHADIKFYVDGVQQLASSTFSMAGLNGGTARVQPYFSLDKPGGGYGTAMQIDYVAVWGRRVDVYDTSDSSASVSPSASPSSSPSSSPSATG